MSAAYASFSSRGGMVPTVLDSVPAWAGRQAWPHGPGLGYTARHPEVHIW